MVHNKNFLHIVDVISTARKSFRPQTPNNETILADQTDYVLDPEWSHISFVNTPNDISRAAVTTVSVHEVYLRVAPLSIDATPLNYKTTFKNKKSNNTSTFLNTQETFNGTRNLTQ